MISIITCSIDDPKFSALSDHLRHVFTQTPCELIRIADARSLAEGYNRAIEKARGDTLIFCHDDIEFVLPDAEAKLHRALANLDVVGVAGTSLLAEGDWSLAGYPHLHGMVLHKHDRPDVPPYVLQVYGASARQVENAQALDGLFFAVRRPVLDKVRFDPVTFDGFHHYDLDFSFRAYLEGFRVGVRCDLGIMHSSSGSFDKVWGGYKQRFDAKFASKLATITKRPHQWIIVESADRADLVSSMVPAAWPAEG